jgi:hypothetical protein
MATLQRQLHELSQQTNSYQIKESFVRSFMERLQLVESLTKKCEGIISSATSKKSKLPSPQEEEEYQERLRFLDGHAGQLRKREEMLAARESEVHGLRT